MISKKEEKSERMDSRRIVPEPGTASLSAKPPYIMDSCLIVDDSSLNRKLLQKHLRPHFKTIFTAENGLEAIEEVKKMIAEDRMFDLICLDSVMPVSVSIPPPYSVLSWPQEMGGPEAIVQIRKLKYSGLVVGVTGNALPEQISSFKVAGVDEVLPKPVDIVELLSVLQHHRRFSSV
jgi:CheY-like chemotaxis protein